jgi:hypothetical protein
MTNLAITANGLRKSYGDKIVLNGADLAVPEGTIFSLPGPNSRAVLGRASEDPRSAYPSQPGPGRPGPVAVPAGEAGTASGPAERGTSPRKRT